MENVPIFDMVTPGAGSASNGTMRGHDKNNEEFRGMVAELAAADDEAARKQVEARIWQRYGTRGAVFVSDMCGFSRTTRAHGICHFLGLIEHARRIITPEILRHGGRLLKFETDNSFAFFADVNSAVHCARDLTASIAETNHARRPEDQIAVAIGIDHGDLLLVDDADFFGDPVNTACKLGEDVAAEGETLVTARAFALCTRDLPYVMDRKHARISGIDVEYARIAFMHARGRR
jgi:adenylate cyclase